MVYLLHSSLLLLSSTTATIFRACLIEFPSEVENEGATRRIKHCHLAWTIQYSLGFVTIEYVVATQVEDVLVRFQPVLHIVGVVKGRREPSHASHDGTGEPVGNLLLSSYVEAC